MGTEIARCFVKGKGMLVYLFMVEGRYIIDGLDFPKYGESFSNREDALKRFNEIIYNACI